MMSIKRLPQSTEKCFTSSGKVIACWATNHLHTVSCAKLSITISIVTRASCAILSSSRSTATLSTRSSSSSHSNATKSSNANTSETAPTLFRAEQAVRCVTQREPNSASLFKKPAENELSFCRMQHPRHPCEVVFQPIFRNIFPGNCDPVVTRAAENLAHEPDHWPYLPLFAPRVFVKSPSIRKMDGRGGGDRKYKLLNKAYALCALQPPTLSNRNKQNNAPSNHAQMAGKARSRCRELCASLLTK